MIRKLSKFVGIPVVAVAAAVSLYAPTASAKPHIPHGGGHYLPDGKTALQKCKNEPTYEAFQKCIQQQYKQ